MKQSTDSTFNSDIAGACTLVDFWAPWCGPCRSQTPILEQFAEQHPEVNVLKVNTDENPDLSRRFGIMSIPTLMVFKNGELVRRVVGTQSLSNLEALIG